MQARLYFASILLVTASSWWLAPAQQSSPIGASKSDRDKAGLRGPVKTVVEEQAFSRPDGQESFTITTTQYAPDGRILEDRTGKDGSGWVTSYSYHSDGRRLKTASGKANSAPSSETTYLYDDVQRLVGVKSGDKVQVRYQYDDKGHKSVIESYDSQSLDPNAFYATHWEGTDLGFAPYPGGTLSTSYNGQGVATGAELHDADGTLVGHIVRKFDAEGRVIAEEQAADAPYQGDLPEELRSKLNREQMKSVGAMIAGMRNCVISYSYDAQGRVTERHRSGGVFGEQVTITTYNDHGDKASERETTVRRPGAGPWNLTEAGAFLPVGKPSPPQPPISSETQYEYQYDEYGNWTEQTMVSRSQPDEAFRPGTVIRRKLNYY